MTVRFRTEDEAAAELGEAARWYNEQRLGLGLEFLVAVDAALEFIAMFPEAGTPVPGLSPDLPVRRIPVKRFPFHVVYVERADEVRILALAHDRRSPGFWRNRAAG